MRVKPGRGEFLGVAAPLYLIHIYRLKVRRIEQKTRRTD
jgi:hypothetical protein